MAVNIARRSYIFCAVAALACSGCQGLQGIRYHEGDIAKVGEGGMHTADAGFEVGLGEAAPSNSGNAAPHPRFHPVPTRPVFEPNGIAAIDAPPAPPSEAPNEIRVEEAQNPLRATRSVLATASNEQPIAKVKALPSEVIDDEGDKEPIEKIENSKEHSSRRNLPDADDAIQASHEDETTPQEIKEPAAFTPVEVATPSSNDMWRPRVGHAD